MPMVHRHFTTYCVIHTFLCFSSDAYGSSFKLIVCHEIGHAIGVNDSYDKRTIMHYNAGFTEAADDVLDWDSRNAVRWLYYIPYPTTTTTSKTNSKTASSYKPPTTTTSSPTTRDGVEFETTTMATYSSASYVSPTKTVLVIYSMVVICLNNFRSDVARFARNNILVAQYRNLNRLNN